MPLHSRSRTVTGSQRMLLETIFDALEEDLELRSRQLLVVSGSQGHGATIETDFLSEIQSEVVDMIDEDSDADEDVEVAPSRSHGEDVDSEARS